MLGTCSYVAILAYYDAKYKYNKRVILLYIHIYIYIYLLLLIININISLFLQQSLRFSELSYLDGEKSDSIYKNKSSSKGLK